MPERERWKPSIDKGWGFLHKRKGCRVKYVIEYVIEYAILAGRLLLNCFTTRTRNVDGITFFWFCNFEIHGSKSFVALQRIILNIFFIFRS